MNGVQPYRATDRGDVADLYRRAYRGDQVRRLRAFEWIHEHNPWTDPDATYLLLRDEGRVVGYLGRMSVRLFIAGKPLAAVYSQEALVDPAVRGRGIATTLFETTNVTARVMISLWHNERIVSLLGKTGWTRVGPLPSLRKIYRLDRLLLSRFPIRPARWLAPLFGRLHRALGRRPSAVPVAYTVEPVSSFGPEFDDLARLAASQHGVIADRGAAVLNWKYGAIPHMRFHAVAVRKDGRLRAYGILRMQETEGGIRKGTIVDALGDVAEPQAMDALAAYCDAYFRDQRADLAAGMFAPARFRKAFRRVGFTGVRPTLTAWLWIRNQHLAPAESAALLDRIDSWYLTLGDSDRDMW